MEWRGGKAEKEGETSLLFTLMLQYSLLRRGGQRLDHPICCQCLHVSPLIFLTKSRIIFQLPFSLSFPRPSLPFIISSHTSACSLTLSPYWMDGNGAGVRGAVHTRPGHACKHPSRVLNVLFLFISQMFYGDENWGL